MGRVPLKREFIRDEKRRRLVFEQRKKSLLKKADELSKLCDVKVGFLIYGMNPDQEEVIWQSSNSDDIDAMIKLYKDQPIDQKKRRRTTSSTIHEDLMRKSRSNLSKLHKENNNSRFPTWDKSYDDLSEEDLRERARVLDGKIEQVKARYKFLKGNQLAYMDNVPQPLDESNFSVPNFNFQPLENQFDFSFSNFNFMNGSCGTMTDLMNNSYCTDDFYIPQISDSSYFSCGNQFGFDPAIMCYNDTQQYNNAAEGFDGFLDGSFGASF